MLLSILVSNSPKPAKIEQTIDTRVLYIPTVCNLRKFHQITEAEIKDILLIQPKLKYETQTTTTLYFNSNVDMNNSYLSPISYNPNILKANKTNDML